MKNKYEELTSSIVELVGGKENIVSFTHCITRLRFNVKDKSKVNVTKIEGMSGVVGTQWQNTQLQIIIGQAVGDVYDAICEAHGFAKHETVNEDLGDQPKKKNVVAMLIETISGCVIPLVPILMGAGMLKVGYLLAVQFGLLSTDSPTYMVLDFVNNSAFYFLPVFVGATSARKFGANLAIGMLVGAMLIHPNFIAAVSAGSALSVFGLPIYSASYTSSIFPVIFSVWVMSKIEKFLTKHSPEVLRAILVPTLTLLVMVPIAFCAVAPVGSFLGTGLAAGINYAFEHFGVVAYALFGILFPVMVVFGMHTALTPYGIQSYATYGYGVSDIMSFVSTTTLTAICCAVALRTKNKNLRSTSGSCAITAFVGGITEPAMFAIALRLKKPFICALIGNACGGIIAGLFPVFCFAMGPANIINVGKFFSPDYPMNLPGALASAAVAFVVAFCLVYFWAYRKSDPAQEQ